MRIFSQEVEESSQISQKLKTTINLWVADLLKEGLIGKFVEINPPLHHSILLYFLNHRIDVL